MKIFDPTEKKEVEVFKQTFELIMKPGTKGTSDDPEVPLAEDIMGNAVHKWVVDDRSKTIDVWATRSILDKISKTHKKI